MTGCNHPPLLFFLQNFIFLALESLCRYFFTTKANFFHTGKYNRILAISSMIFTGDKYATIYNFYARRRFHLYIIITIVQLSKTCCPNCHRVADYWRTQSLKGRKCFVYQCLYNMWLSIKRMSVLNNLTFYNI